MSSLFNQASLVVEPAVYETSKVYATKPFDGSGDLSFSRSNDTATRVNSAGLIEKVRTNLALQSQTFDNASWVKYNSSVTANSTTAPDGTSTADSLVDNTANDIHVTYQSIALSAGEHTISCYAKANTLSHLSIYIFDGTNFFSSGIFNLSNGTVSGAGSIVSAGNGWYRVSFTTTIGSGSGNVYIALSNGSTISYVGSGQSIYIWGYQVEAGVATDYIATTSAAVSVGPVANVPRLDYLNSSCPRLLLEPQRTNLFTYSEDITITGAPNWIQYGGVTVTANNTASPDGYLNADKMDSTGGVYTQKTFTAGTAYAISVFIKKDTATLFRINYVDQSGPYRGGEITYTFATGAIAVTQSANSSISGEAVDYGNGWIRLVLKMTANAAANYSYQSFDFDGGTGWVWGFQMEAGAYATSYIPTLGAAVTRGADACSKTGISSLIGQTEGTIFFDFVAQVSTTAQSHFWLGSVGNEIGIYGGGSFIFYSSGGVSIAGGSFVTGQRYKIAFAYKANDYVAYVNGVQKGTDTSATVPATSALYVNSYSDFTEIQKKEVNQALLFKTRLPNSELAKLTSL